MGMVILWGKLNLVNIVYGVRTDILIDMLESTKW